MRSCGPVTDSRPVGRVRAPDHCPRRRFDAGRRGSVARVGCRPVPSRAFDGHTGTVVGVELSPLKQDGLSAVDPARVNQAVTSILQAMAPSEGWVVTTPGDLEAPVVVRDVDVAGLRNDTIRVRVSRVHAEEIATALGVPDMAPEDVVAEVANTIAGHLKVFLAPNMATGIPQRIDGDSGPLPGYRAQFIAEGRVVEVSSHG